MSPSVFIRYLLIQKEAIQAFHNFSSPSFRALDKTIFYISSYQGDFFYHAK